MTNSENQATATRQRLFACLDRLGVRHETHEHPAIFTVAEGAELKKAWPGGHSKNLFLKDKAGSLFLAVARDQTQVDLKELSRRVAKGRLSFGKAELLLDVLGVTPGSVTPFALMNDTEQQTTALIDTALLVEERVYFHPLENTASTAISPQGLIRFIGACGHRWLPLDLSAPGLDPRLPSWLNRPLTS